MFTSPQQGWITNTPSNSDPCWGSWLLTSHPLPHLQHPSPALSSDSPLTPFSLSVNPPFLHMLCWHVACCVCQLVNARCTAADKDQKDITNNRLLTGERDTQVPPRKSPPQLTPSPHHPPTCPLPSPAAKSHHLHLTGATPQQDTCTALSQIIICNWIMSQQKAHRATGLSESVKYTHKTRLKVCCLLEQ